MIHPSLIPYESRLREFFQGMLYKLDMNAHKKTPEVVDIPGMTEMLLDELNEFTEQFVADSRNVNTVIELFDVSNFAFLMFLALRNKGNADWRSAAGEVQKGWLK